MTNRPLLLLASLLFIFTSYAEGPVRILAIGNSFSEDATEYYLHKICASEGMKVEICNLYVAACTIDMHLSNLRTDAKAYRYRKIDVKGKMTERTGVKLKDALRDGEWDYITFQQGSALSGLPDSYSNLSDLLISVREIVGPKPAFAWHMTWAYAGNSKHSGFAAYNNNQLQMFHSIEKTTRLILRQYPELKILIPCGTAIQDARTAILAGDDLTRDGYHLNEGIGRFIASCTWYAAIFRRIIYPDVWRPKGITEDEMEIALDAAHLAVMHPFSITPLHILASKHTKEHF